jgi:hypothetical protein
VIRRHYSNLDQATIAERAIKQGLGIATETDARTLARPLRAAE